MCNTLPIKKSNCAFVYGYFQFIGIGKSTVYLYVEKIRLGHMIVLLKFRNLSNINNFVHYHIN